MAALVANLELLAKRDFKSLKRRCGVDEDDLVICCAKFVRSIPKPGNQFHSGGPEVIIPDVLIQPSPGGWWQIELNPETLPRLLINQPICRGLTSHRQQRDPQSIPQ
ncbi:hypothetical protein [Mesorhizobium captivum]|uniref:RNA polymerase factor sigma-54 n=1 Tax=Mesorhizobium captivum TaxID=3072319 RepID=UPI003D6BF078